VIRAALVVTMLALATIASAQEGPQRLAVKPFALLPADVRHPEALAVDAARGEVYVATFDAREPASARNNVLLRYSAHGRLLARRAFGATPLTGIAVHGGDVWVLNFGASTLQRIAAGFDADTPVRDVVRFAALSPSAPSARRIDNPDGSHDTVTYGSAGFPAPNGLAFDAAGNAYVSDSFQGAILRIDDAAHCAPCEARVVSRDPLLGTAGALPFGANGLAFDAAGTTLYVNNAGDGRLLRVDLTDGRASVVADGLYGADGLVRDGDLYWVAANQIDAVIGVGADGRVRAIAGRFDGIGADGAPRGLLFPASAAVLGRRMIVANLALPLTPAAGDEWEERVTRWNLVQFDLPR
jgi:DNA-binding beta-propeller fold protein YncE